MFTEWLDLSYPLFASPIVRAALATLFVWTLALLCGRRCIVLLSRYFREPIISDSGRLRFLHRAKQSTPTMGGLFLVAALFLSTILVADLHNAYVWVALYVLVSFGIVGACDDLTKIRGAGRGLSPRTKLMAQTLVLIPAALILSALRTDPLLQLSTDFVRHTTIAPVNWTLMPWIVLVILGTSNAVNLTDGLDGLAGGCLLAALVALVLLIVQTSQPVATGPQELLVVAGATIGGLLGFLRFNRHPAQVFMGNTGSLALGALLACLAVATRYELWLVLIGGVFVIETLSVVIQVASYRWFGRRVLLCAPLHHHFQFQGMSERRIVHRFWLAAACCAMLGLIGGSTGRTALWDAGDIFSAGLTRPVIKTAAVFQELATVNESP